MKKFHSFIICLMFLGLVNCYAQEKFFYSFRKIEQNNGLSSPNIRKITKDTFGYFWFATQDGLNRYDGNKILVYNSAEKSEYQQTNGNDFHDIVAESDILWALTSNGGLNKIDIKINRVLHKESFSKYKEQGDWFRTVSVWKNYLVISTYQGKIILYDKEKSVVTRVIDIGAEVKQELLTYFFILKGNNCWLFCKQSGILVYNLEKGKIVKQIAANSEFKKKFGEFGKIILNDSYGSILASTSTGIIEIDNKNLTIKNWALEKLINRRQAGNNKIFALAQNDFYFFISTENKIFQFNKSDNSVKELSPHNYQLEKGWFEGILSIYSDNKHLLLGGQYGIALIPELTQLYSAFYSSYDNFSVKIDHNYHLCGIGDSIVYSCASNGLYKTNIKTGIITLLDDSQPYYQAIPIDKGRVLFSGENKFKIINGPDLVDALTFYPSLEKIKNNFIIASVFLNDSIILMAGQVEKLIYLFNIKKGVIDVLNKNSYPLSYDGGEINNFFINHNRQVIICSNSSLGFFDYEEKGIVYKNVINPENNQPFEAFMDGVQIEDNYFFAIYGVGIVQTDTSLKVKHIFSKVDGLSSTGVYKIYQMNDSLAITSSNNGLYILNVKDGKIKILDKSYGLQSDYFDETSGFLSTKYIYFGGLNGFSKIDYKNYTLNKVPPLFYFSSLNIQTNKSEVNINEIDISRIQIPNNYTQVRINFVGINYSNPSKTIYAYYIKELQNQWIQLENQQFINLIGIGPGKYHVLIKAANEDGVWSEPKELILVFLPKWYQTLLFKILVVLTITSIIYALYRYRISQIKKQHEIRRNIATDLHDDLGSTLNSVKVFTNLAISGVNQDESLQQIKDNLKEATTGLRDMIWVLDDSLDTVDELVTRLKQFALPVAAASNIEVDIKTEPGINSKQLTKEEKRNLFLVCKEAINNSIKYAEASRIDISISSAGKKIRIGITDNGKGFDEATIKKGYGLKNMQYRSSQVKYKTSIQSVPGKGTIIEIFPG